MLVGKNSHVQVQCNLGDTLTEDNWAVKHVYNRNTGENNLIETYEGEVIMDQTHAHKYL